MEQPADPSLDQIQRVAIQFGLACARTRIGYIGSGKEDIIFEVRDSLIYRAWAVKWHLHFLRQQHQALEARLMKNINAALNNPQFLHDSQQLQSYIFDDVIFNLAAMFDYVGNLVGLAYRGPTKSRTKWNGAVKGARDPNNSIHRAPVAPLLVDAHSSWVNHLMDFRGDHIHHKAELGSTEHSLNASADSFKVAVKVCVPRSLGKRLLGAGEEDIDMLDGADSIAETSAKHCNSILAKMTETMEPDFWS